MTCGQHVVRKCSFCVTMTRAFAWCNVSKECLRQSVVTSSWSGDWHSILPLEHTVWRTSTRRQDSTYGVGFLYLWHVRNVGTSFGTGVASEVLVLLIQLLGVRRLARTLLLFSLLATLPTHVCSMRPVFRFHALFSTALTFSVTSTLTLVTALLLHLSHLLQSCGC